jgi:nitrogen fixation NifU-like protein
MNVSYSGIVLDHFQNPRNTGDLREADAEVRMENPACGDIMTLALTLANGRIDKVRYRVRGCVAAIAAGSCLTELIQDKPLAEAEALTRQQLVDALGGLPNASIHASHLAMDALNAALRKLRTLQD